jgi:hypothetical protein
MHKFLKGDCVVIADRPEVWQFAGRVGVIHGWTKPSITNEGPVHGRSDDDFAWAVYFDDSDQMEWFAHYLLLPAE